MKTNSIGFVPNFWISLILTIVIFNLNQHECTVVELTDKNFAQVVSSRPFTMVVFYADWCHHCQTLLPELDASDDILVQNRIHAIAKVNCNTSGKETCDNMKITYFPTIYTMLYGQVTDQYKNEYDAKSITNYIISRLNVVLGANGGLSVPTPAYNYLTNSLNPQLTAPSLQMNNPWQKSFEPPSIDQKPSDDDWIAYDVFKYNQNYNNIRESNFYNPPSRYPNYENFWSNSNINFPNYPAPFNPSFPFDNIMYQHAMSYLYNTFDNNHMYKNVEPSERPSFKYSPLPSPRQYLESITWGDRDMNPWFNMSPYFRSMNNYYDSPKPSSNWFEYAGLKKHNITSISNNAKKLKSNRDWEWNPDLDLGHRPAVRQYMIPSKYRANAAKSSYLRGIIKKYLNENESNDDHNKKKHSIPSTKSNKELPPFHNSPNERIHPTKDSDSFKLIVDALRKYKP